MAKPKVYISPSDQGGNKYAAGNTNEEKQCERIAVALEKALERCGIDALNNMTDSMQERVRESNAWGADLHMPLHTNAFDEKVAGTRLMCYDLKGKGYKACKAIFKYLAPLTPGTSENISVRTDLYEINQANAPTAYVEVDFHDVAKVAKWIIDNVEEIAEEICKGVCDYFNVKYKAPAATTTKPSDTSSSKNNNTTQKKMYRVFRVTKDKTLQRGAFSVIDNAMNMAKKELMNGNDVKLTVRDK